MIHTRNQHHEGLALLPQLLTLAAIPASLAWYVFKQYIRADKPKDKRP